MKGLPQHGYPYASAITSMRLPIAGEHRVRILRLDPHAVHASESEDASRTVAIFGRPRSKTARDAGALSSAMANEVDKKLWLARHLFSIDKNPPSGAIAIAPVIGHGSPGSSSARGAVGISDEDGMLQWIELLPEDAPNAETSDAMLKILERIGCSSRGLLSGDVRAFLGGSLDVGGEPSAPASVGVRLLRSASPGATQMFESTPVVPQSVWQPLQSQRVKWRPTLAPPDKPAASSSASSSSPTAPPKPPGVAPR